MLFWFRLALYYVFLVIPLSHPTLMVFADSASFWALFIFTPAMAVLGYLKPELKNRPRSIILWPLGLILLSIPLLGITSTAASWYLLGLWAWLSSYLAFNRSLYFLLYPEPFAAAWVLLRLVGFSQSSQGMMEQSFTINGLIILLLFMAVLALLLMIFFLPLKGRKKIFPRREFLLLLILIIPLAVGGLSSQSARQFQNLIRQNTPDGLRPQRGSDDRDQGDAESGSNGESGQDGSEMDQQGQAQGGMGDNQEAQGGEGDQQQGNSLYETSSEEWQKGASGKDGQNRQYMVMIVHSNLPTAYMAQDYWGILDGEQGFLPDENLYLNDLSKQRYLETWTNDARNRDLNRQDLELEVFSTLAYPQVPYFPISLEPMIRKEAYAPLSYSYRSISRVSKLIPYGGDADLPMYSQHERDVLANYLEVNLPESQRQRYQAYLDELDLPENSSTAIIRGIFNSFKEFQYEVGYSEDTRIEAVEHFLFDTQRGDCTEFSHSAALLGRIAGIPSRVVTGYLASRDLQTNAHREGIFELQQVHSELASFNPSELYMVTTAHRHAWVQFYLPNHGWVDYEATAYAIPPSPGTDMNQSDVVIPQLTPMNSKNLLVNLPWKKMGRVFLLLILSALTFQFLRRRIAMGRLNSLSKGEDERALKAIYSLMIQRYNGRVKNPKDPSLTPKEMAKQWEQLKDFARIYEVTLYNPALSKDQYQDHLGFLRRESQRLIKDYSRAEHLLRGLFSLREVQ